MPMTESPASQQVATPHADVHDALAQALDKSLQLAMSYHKAGQFDHAETLYRGILTAAPQHAQANFFLGRIAIRVGQAREGLPYFEAALHAQPGNAEYRTGYIDALIQAGEVDAARELLASTMQLGMTGKILEALARKLEIRARIERTIRDTQASTASAQPLRARPASPISSGKAQPSPRELAKLATHYKQKRYDEAKALARSMTQRFSRHGFAWKVLGAVLSLEGDLQGARHPMEMAAQLMPTDAEAELNVAQTLVALGHKTEAEESYRRVLEINPVNAKVHLSLSHLIKDQARQLEAELHCRRAIEIDPAYVEAHCALGLLLKEKRKLPEAEESFRMAMRADPKRSNAYNLLGQLLSEQERWTEAETVFRDAIVVDPAFGASYTNLGLTLNAQGRQHEANADLRRGIEARPTDPEIHTALLYSLTLGQTSEPDALFAEHCRFGEKFEAPLRATWRPHENLRDPERTLQVGFVSGDLYNHAVASFIEPILQQLAGSSTLVVHAYSTRRLSDDAMSKRLRRQVKHWHTVGKLAHEALAEKIRADGIDILIDLSGHTTDNRLVVFARKPAPVQVSWMGYPGTTGLESIDYYLCDRFLLPAAGQFHRQFTEKLVYLPANAPFLPFAKAGPINELPALQAGHITFGSFNRLNKFNRNVIAVWSQLLRAVPDSRMVLGGMPRGGNQYDIVLQWFDDEGIDRGRLDFHERTDMPRYMALHHQVDMCLDTFPYNGGTTSLHSFLMGVPTLTIAGDTLAGRVGAGLQGHVGLDEFVASDAAAFVAQGISWANRVPELAQLRASLRDRFNRSAISQPALIASGLESALRTMWQRWCAGLPAESFDAQVNQGDRA